MILPKRCGTRILLFGRERKVQKTRIVRFIKFGASGFLMGIHNILGLSRPETQSQTRRRFWEQIEAATMEIDGRSVVRSVPESAGQTFDLFYLGIDAFSQRVGDSMPRIGYDVL